MFRWNYAGLECYGPGGAPIPEYVALLSRTYAQAIAGVPVSMSFNRTTALFTLCYTLAPVRCLTCVCVCDIVV